MSVTKKNQLPCSKDMHFTSHSRQNKVALLLSLFFFNMAAVVSSPVLQSTLQSVLTLFSILI